MDELGRHLVVGRVGGSEDGGRAAVLELALAGRHVEVHGVAHERMHEAERRVGTQDLRPREVAGRACDRILAEAQRSLDEANVEPARAETSGFEPAEDPADAGPAAEATAADEEFKP